MYCESQSNSIDLPVNNKPNQFFVTSKNESVCMHNFITTKRQSGHNSKYHENTLYVLDNYYLTAHMSARQQLLVKMV
jgi:hypothetical protein